MKNYWFKELRKKICRKQYVTSEDRYCRIAECRIEIMFMIIMLNLSLRYIISNSSGIRKLRQLKRLHLSCKYTLARPAYYIGNFLPYHGL